MADLADTPCDVCGEDTDLFTLTRCDDCGTLCCRACWESHCNSHEED